MNARNDTDLLGNRTPRGMLRLVLRFALPSILGAAVISFYNLADAYFVSSLGKEAGAAVGVSFAIVALLQAIGYTLGIGGGVLISRALGAGRADEATDYARVSVRAGFWIGIVILLSGLILRMPLMGFLGADDAVAPLAASYATFLLLSSPFTVLGFVLSHLLRAEGRVLDSTLGLAVGSVLNCILDPICITRLGLGVAGASLATLISQGIAAMLLLLPYLRGKCRVSLLGRNEKAVNRPLLRVLYRGMPSFFRQGLIVPSTILLNRTLMLWGDAAVSAFSSVTRLFLLVFSLCIGVGQGMMPIVAYNDGCGRRDSVREAFVLSLRLSLVLAFLASLPLLILSTQLISLFQSSQQAVEIGCIALRAQAAVLILHAPITCTVFLLQALGKGIRATLLACARQGLFFIPLILLIPRCFGVEWTIFVQPLADVATFLLTLPFMIGFLKQTKRCLTKAVKHL